MNIKFIVLVGHNRFSLIGRFYCMRRQYRQPSPARPFINSYHVNEVPLPYYNPLADPYLKGFFSNSQNAKRIRMEGLLYCESKEYPYAERRLTNFNKFLRSNSCYVPSRNLIKPEARPSFIAKSMRSSCCLNENEVTRSDLFQKGLSESELSSKPQKLQFLEDIISKRPSTQTSSRRRSVSSRGGRGIYFRSKNF